MREREPHARRGPVVWAWQIKHSNGRRGLCLWAEPDKRRLLERGKPDPRATAVRVRLERF